MAPDAKGFQAAPAVEGAIATVPTATAAATYECHIALRPPNDFPNLRDTIGLRARSVRLPFGQPQRYGDATGQAMRPP
jgi:hypothetical protein